MLRLFSLLPRNPKVWFADSIHRSGSKLPGRQDPLVRFDHSTSNSTDLYILYLSLSTLSSPPPHPPISFFIWKHPVRRLARHLEKGRGGKKRNVRMKNFLKCQTEEKTIA